MLMSKLRPRRFTSQKIFRINKVVSSRNKMRRNVAKFVYLLIDNSSSMLSEKISILSEKEKELNELRELIQENLQERVNALEAELETIHRESARKRVSRSKRMRHSVISIARKKTIEKVFRNKLKEMRNLIRILLFGERYAPWHRISPPNRSEICWRSAVATG